MQMVDYSEDATGVDQHVGFDLAVAVLLDFCYGSAWVPHSAVVLAVR